MSAKLDQKAIRDWLKDRDGWKAKGKAITKEYTFKSFRSTIVFVNRIATLADEAKHHPDIDIRYTKVTLILSTHDAGGVTERDLELARAIDFATSAR
jgi:4a-hydroxytetrahydrobiopterin dehydratase